MKLLGGRWTRPATGRRWMSHQSASSVIRTRLEGGNGEGEEEEEEEESGPNQYTSE